MKFAMIVDGCVQRSYYVKDGKSYKLKADNEEPYSHHHSINNECHLGIWGYPFLFEGGYFINWTEWDELPKLDLDIILVAIEKNQNMYNVGMLRKSYPNALIMSFVKEAFWVNSTLEQRINFFKDCDYITFQWKVDDDNDGGILGINTLSKLCNKEVYYLPQPNDIDFLYNNYYKQERDLNILSYKSPEGLGRSGNTIDFAKYVGDRYGIEVINHIVKYKGTEHKQWMEFLDGITSSTYCFNLDTTLYGGSMGVQCAALGLINIGGIQDSHKILWNETATNDLEVLGKIFYELHTNVDKRVELIQSAFNNARKYYSHKAVRQVILDILKN